VRSEAGTSQKVTINLLGLNVKLLKRLKQMITLQFHTA